MLERRLIFGLLSLVLYWLLIAQTFYSHCQMG